MKIILFLCIAMNLIACADTPKAETATNANTVQSPKIENPAVLEVVVEGCKESVSLTSGQVLKLKLPATAGTGYSWSVAKSPEFMGITNADAMTFEPMEKPEEGKVGYATWQVLEFKTTAAGEGMLELNYVRPFEPTKIEQTCKIKVMVK